MKAMLLAAGRGERLRPLTDHTAKPLIVAGGRSLIEYHLESLASAGIVDIVINTCWQADKIVRQLGDGANYSVNIEYSHESVALETAGGIAHALKLLGDRPFLVISADTWCDCKLSDLTLAPERMAQLLMVPNPPHHPEGDFAIHGGALIDGTPRYTYSGLGIYHPDLFRNLPETRWPLLPLIKQGIQNQHIGAQLHSGRWFDIGTVERLEQLDHLLSNPQ